MKKPFLKMRNMSYFGDKLREARKAAGYTQEELAQALGMIRTNYIPYETGKVSPDPVETIPRIANAIGVDSDRLRAWKLIDEASPEVIRLANQYLEFEKGLGKEKVKERLEAEYQKRQQKKGSKG